MFACSNFYFRLQLPLIIIHITCISLSLCRTSAPIHLTNVLGVLGTQETSCILIARLLERDTFDPFLLCTWRPNTVYKNRSMRRHHTMACIGGFHLTPTQPFGESQEREGGAHEGRGEKSSSKGTPSLHVCPSLLQGGSLCRREGETLPPPRHLWGGGQRGARAGG
jgi:hypothetical protein